jgi:hypothetical protein
MSDPAAQEEQETPTRRLIIVVVKNGEEPLIELDPPGSFAYWEVEAALHRTIENLQQEEFEEALAEGEDEDGGEPDA